MTETGNFPRSDAVAGQQRRQQKVDDVLTRTEVLIQGQIDDNETFMKKLNSASQNLSATKNATSVERIVMSLVADNEDMRERMSNLSVREALKNVG